MKIPLVIRGRDLFQVRLNAEHLRMETARSRSISSGMNLGQGAFQDIRPIEWLENFIDEDVISLLVSESNMYTVKKNMPGDKIALEMQLYIPCHLQDGCRKKKRLILS